MLIDYYPRADLVLPLNSLLSRALLSSRDIDRELASVVVLGLEKKPEFENLEKKVERRN